MGPRLPAVLLVALAVAGTGTEPGIPDAEELRAVVVDENAVTVEVWIALPPTVDPSSVEVQLAGRVVAVRARDEAGRTLRSAPLHLREAVVEDNASARYEGFWLAVTLRKDSPPAY